LDARVFHTTPLGAGTITVEAFNTRFESLWKRTSPSGERVDLGSFQIPSSLRDEFFFLVAELRDPSGRLLSRSTYWPRSLARMEDTSFRDKYRATPQPNIAFENGPWLKPSVAATRTSLELKLISTKATGADLARVVVRLANTGRLPAFPVGLDIDGALRCFYAEDNFFWLAPGEQREIVLEVQWRETRPGKTISVSASAWNAAEVRAALPVEPVTR
jgi:beta-mannosidase